MTAYHRGDVFSQEFLWTRQKLCSTDAVEIRLPDGLGYDDTRG